MLTCCSSKLENGWRGARRFEEDAYVYFSIQNAIWLASKWNLNETTLSWLVFLLHNLFFGLRKLGLLRVMIRFCLPKNWRLFKLTKLCNFEVLIPTSHCVMPNETIFQVLDDGRPQKNCNQAALYGLIRLYLTFRIIGVFPSKFLILQHPQSFIFVIFQDPWRCGGVTN